MKMTRYKNGILAAVLGFAFSFSAFSAEEVDTVSTSATEIDTAVNDAASDEEATADLSSDEMPGELNVASANIRPLAQCWRFDDHPNACQNQWDCRYNWRTTRCVQEPHGGGGGGGGNNRACWNFDRHPNACERNGCSYNYRTERCVRGRW